MSTPALSDMTLTDVCAALHRMIEVLDRPLTMEPGSARTRVSIESAAATLTAVTTVATVTSMTQLAGFDAKLTLLNGIERNLWSNAVRSRIT